MGKAAVAEWDDLEFFDWEAEKAKKAARPKSANQNEFWTPERVETLTKLWNEGLYASDIGKTLGCTRNAVIGKANRLNLPARDQRLFRRVVKHGKGRKLKTIGRGKGRPS